MSIRCYTFDPSALMLFLLGSGNAQVPPPLPPDVVVGPQPPAEKEMNFCPVAGFGAFYDGPVTCGMGVAVSEETQTF